MKPTNFRLELSLFGYTSILEQLKEQDCEIKNVKHINEIKQYEDLITSINFSHLMDVVTAGERNKIFERVTKRIAKLISER